MQKRSYVQKQLLKSWVLGCAMAVTASAWAADPTLHEVYEAANSGRVQQAEGMMAQVLRDHPASAKAHYVAAEVHARAGHFDAARSELRVAEQIDPQLSFANAASASRLRAELAPRSSMQNGISRDSGRTGISLGWIVLLVAGALAFFLFRRRRASSLAASGYAARGGYPGAGNYAGAAPAGSPYPGGMAPPVGGMGGGFGSSLASGLAVGAGVVAGEELMHRFTQGGEHTRLADSGLEGAGGDPANSAWDQNANMGGADFGVSDAGSWNDAGASNASWDGGDSSGGSWDGGSGGGDWT